MVATILQASKADHFKDGAYLGLALSCLALFLLSKKFRRKA
jgi:hypothetical protein